LAVSLTICWSSSGVVGETNAPGLLLYWPDQFVNSAALRSMGGSRVSGSPILGAPATLRKRFQQAFRQFGEVSARVSWARPHAHDHDVARRNDHRVLPHGAVSPIGVFGNSRPCMSTVDPEHSAVPVGRIGRRGSGDELRP